MRFERLMSLKIRLLNCAKENGFSDRETME